MPVVFTWSLLKWGLVLTALAALAAFAVLFVVTRIENQQARDNTARLQGGTATEQPGTDVAVVYFSRSGNTAVAAQHIAQRMGARLLAIEAPEYEPGLPGIARALRDARGHDAHIAPTAADLQGVRTVYLGAPSGCTARHRPSGPLPHATASMGRMWCCSTPSTAGSSSTSSTNSANW